MLQLPAVALKVLKCHFWRFLAQFSQDTALLLDSMISRNSRTISTWKENDLIQMCFNHVWASSCVFPQFFQVFLNNAVAEWGWLGRVYRACRIPRPVLVAGENLKWTQRAGSAGQSLPHRRKVDTSHCSMISMLLIVVQATAFALESEPSTDVHEGLSHRLCLKCKFLRYEWSLLLTRGKGLAQKHWGSLRGTTFCGNCAGQQGAPRRRDCDDWMTAMCGKVCSLHPAPSQGSGFSVSPAFKARAELEAFDKCSAQKTWEIWKNPGRSGKTGSSREIRTPLQSIQCVGIADCCGAGVYMRKVSPNTHISHVQLSSWRRLLTQSSMWGLFSEERSHNICARLHS